MGITIVGWVIIGIGIVVLIAGFAIAAFFMYQGETGPAIAAVIIGIILAASCIVGVIIYKNTEAGKRAYKDQQSNFSNGISRTVRVFDINGNIIEEYSGQFDIETDHDHYILFDDEQGKRHIIYFTTGTIIVDEN